MKEVELTIFGNVQGVGFRAFTKQQAQELDLVGYVRNDPEGHVEVVAQGEEENLREFMEKLEEGPAFAQVDDKSVRWHDRTQDTFTDFEIRQ